MSARALDMATAVAAPDDGDMFALVPADADWSVVEAHTSPRHTAERLRVNDPQKYDILKRALAGGATISGLANSHKVGIHTLYAIIERDLGGLQQFNAGRAQGWRNVANLCVERAVELVPKAKSLTELGMLGGIAEDKAAMLSGTPGLVVRHEHVSVSAREEMEAVIAAMYENAGRENAGRENAGRENAEKLKTEKLKTGVVIEADSDFSVSASQLLSISSEGEGTSNVQRPTSNIELSEREAFDVGRSALDVGRYPDSGEEAA